MASNENNEVLVMLHNIRYWKQKAWRAEQKLAREVGARKLLEKELDLYKSIPADLLEPVLLEAKKKELRDIEKKVDSIFQTIGLFTMTRLRSESEKYKDTDGKIRFWKQVISIYDKRLPESDETDTSDDEEDE